MSLARPVARLGNVPALDGLRALAIATVVVSHTRFSRLLPGGGIGVDLFFVLSGFLITTLLMEEWRRRGSIDIGAFYMRRAIRLGPALVLLLGGVFLMSFAPPLAEATPGEVARFSLYVLTYTSNWVLALQLQHWPSLLGHLWSLAVEEQFYLVWPVLLFVALRRGGSPRGLCVALLATVAALAVWRAIVWHTTHDVHRVYFATDCRASGMLLGAALGAGRAMGLRVARPVASVLAMGGLLLYAWTARHVDQQTSYPFLLGLKLVELASAAMLLGLGAGDAGPIARALAWPPLVWLGRRSYAVYLWHVPLLYAAYHLLPGGDVMTTVAGVGMTLGVSVLSWRFVEAPALRHKSRFERSAPALLPQAA
jgi:peptidoglycan/LPS O-acetylase OafA/YrhL